MHRILFEIQIPYVFKALFGIFPWALGIIFGFIGLLFLFFGPKWFLKQDEEAIKDEKLKLQKEKEQKRWLRLTFWVGLVFVIIAIGSIATAILENDKAEKIAKGRLSNIHSSDEAFDVEILSTEAAYQKLVDADGNWLTNDPIYRNLKTAMSEMLSKPGGDNYFKTVSYKQVKDFENYLDTTGKIELADFKQKYEDFKKLPEDSDFPLKTIEVPSYGVMVMFGFLAAIMVAYFRAKQYGIDPNIVIDLGIIVMIFAIIGARIWYVVEYWGDQFYTEGSSFFEAIKKAFMIQQGGLVFYGGLICAAVASLLYLRMKKQKIWFFLDFLAICVPLGHAFGRTGCFLNGCCFGKPCNPDNILAVAFPTSLATDVSHIPAYTPVYATQMLEVLTNVIIFILLTIFYERYAKKRGETFFLYFVFYGISRFFNQMLRADVPSYSLGLSSSQVLSILLIAGGLAFWGFFRFKRKNELAPHLAGLKNSPFKKMYIKDLQK